MDPAPPPASDVQDYFAAQPDAVRDRLSIIREIVLDVASGGDGEVTERLSYQIPTVFVGGRVLVHFAGFAKHTSMYPVPPCEGPDAASLEAHRAGKGTLKFPLEKPLPLDIVRRVAELHLARVEGR